MTDSSTGPHDGPTRYGAGRWDDGRRPEIGTRVVVRRHLTPGQTSHLFTDVLGHVEALEPELAVRRANGELVVVPSSAIAVLKVLPARPVRNRDIRALEYCSALAWPGTERELVDGWLCRAGDPWSYRADSAVPVLPWASPEALDGVRDWYAARGLPLRIELVDRLVDPSRVTLDGAPVDPARLDVGRGLHLCTGPSSGLVAEVPDAGDRVRVVDAPDDDWLALYHGTAGLDPELVRPALLATSGMVDGEPGVGGHVGFARLELDGELAALARGAVTTGPDGVPRVGVSCVETAPDHRRRGLAEVVTSALALWGRGFGAKECHLHVFDDNAAGSALWAKLGSVPHHALRHVTIH